MHPRLVDFLNHGLLPFVGREQEQQRILAFWNGGQEQFGLRALLLMGEAGSGKSRMIEELIPQIEQQGGLVLHLRLRADGSGSIAPLLALAVGGSAVAAHLLNAPMTPTLPAAIGALRRLGRLRRVMLIVEDLHLLSGATVREFGMLVDALADEPLSLLAVSRPAELTARGALEAYLTAELHLQDFHPDDITQLWKELFGNHPSNNLITTFADATLGNPLAFRSALQGALNAGAIAGGTDGWEATIPLADLALLTERSAHQLSQGMAAHLNDAERAAACALATLGEAFSPEAAELLLPGTSRAITTLIFKGILVRSGTAIHPLRGGPAASLPLTFTHTLLHRTLLESATVDSSGLARVVAAQPPIYSALPYRLLADHPAVDCGSIAEAETLVNELLATAARIDNSPDWELAVIPWRAAQQITLHTPLLNDPAAKQKFELNVLAVHLSINGRNDNTTEFYQQAEKLVELTAQPTTDHLRISRLRGYIYLFRSAARLRRSQCPEIITAVEAMAAQWPELRRTREYAGFLRIVASTAYTHGLHIQDLRYVEQSVRQLVAEQGGDPAIEAAWLHDVGYHLLLAFTTPDELAERHRMLRQLRDAGIDKPHTYLRIIAFYTETGAARQAIAEVERCLPTLRDFGLLRTAFTAQHYCCQCLLMIGQPIELVLQQAEALFSQVPPETEPGHRQHMGEHLIACALACGQTDVAKRLIEVFQLQRAGIARTAQLLLACWAGSPAEAIRELEGVEIPMPDNGPDDPDAHLTPLLPAVAAVRWGKHITTDELQEVLHLLCSPILWRFQLLAIHAGCVLGELLIEMKLIPEPESSAETLRSAMATALENAARWGKQNDLHPVVLGVQQRYLRLGRNAVEPSTPVRPEAAAITATPSPVMFAGETSAVRAAVRVGLFGPITVQQPNGAAVKLRGTRNQITLCLLVADQMLKNPLSRNRFIEIASGVPVADAPHKARRGMNMAIMRLREAIGQQTIITDGEIPQLNPATVTVDLIEARQTIQRVGQLTRRGTLTEARQTLSPLLPLMRQGQPFAAMEDELFQNLQSQWEQEFRSVVGQLLQRLRDAGDPHEANVIESQLPEGFLQ